MGQKKRDQHVTNRTNEEKSFNKEVNGEGYEMSVSFTVWSSVSRSSFSNSSTFQNRGFQLGLVLTTRDYLIVYGDIFGYHN